MTAIDNEQPDIVASISVLLVRLATEQYALPAEDLREVVRWRPVTPVPGAPETLPGIIAQRGAVLPVVDLRRLLGLPAGAPERGTRYVVAAHNGTDLALLVDQVLDLVALDAASLEPPPANLGLLGGRLLRAVTRHDNQPLALIDLGAVITALDGGA